MALTRLHIMNMVLLAVAGVLILGLSLLTANSLLMRGSGSPAQQWKLYFGREILPDNILYPMLMIRDKIRLDSSPESEQVPIKVEYAEKRFKTSQALLDTNQGMLAVSTLTKSQKYIISAGYQLINSPTATKEELIYIRGIIEKSIERLETFSKENPQYDQPILGQLREESRILLMKVDEKIINM